jgi:hypothetical protein
VKAPEENLISETTKIQFRVENLEDPNMKAEYDTVFTGPKR